MPTFTRIALETLLEPRDSYENNLKQHLNPNLNPKPNHIYISPALYTTPEPTPVTDSSPDSLSPFPYVFNRKGRGGKVADNREDIQVEEEIEDDDFSGTEIVEERIENSVVVDDFFDLKFESTSVASSIEINDSGKEVENLSCVSTQGEFYDANDDFSSDGSFSNGTCRVQSLESEMRATRLTLLEEIEKRKAVEESLALMKNQLQKVRNFLSTQNANNNNNMQIDIYDDSIEQLCQEIVVSRFVSEAIGKAESRAEAEVAAELIIDSKRKEISRLQDRLNYYEAVNHEMCQRNQEVVEIARRQRQEKKVQRRWLWGCIGFSITIGASVIAYTFLPQATTSGDLPEPPSSASSSPESI